MFCGEGRDRVLSCWIWTLQISFRSVLAVCLHVTHPMLQGMYDTFMLNRYRFEA